MPKARTAQYSVAAHAARYGPSGDAEPNATDESGVSVMASAVTAPARASPLVSRFAVLAAKIVATTPHRMKPIRTANGLVPSQLNAKIV